LSDNVTCKYCQSPNVIKYGKLNGVQRYFCKSCNRKFANPDAIPKMQTPTEQIADALNLWRRLGEESRHGYNNQD
jgi:transposase-like protein